jgi:hypothetical protein
MRLAGKAVKYAEFTSYEAIAAVLEADDDLAYSIDGFS